MARRTTKKSERRLKPQHWKLYAEPAWFNPFHILTPGDNAPEECNAFIECPMRSKIKYELDKRNGILHISRTLHSAVHYPSNYGFVRKHTAATHDPLTCGAFAGTRHSRCVMRARPIGIVADDRPGFEDIKIIAIHVNDPMLRATRTSPQLPPHMLRDDAGISSRSTRNWKWPRSRWWKISVAGSDATRRVIRQSVAATSAFAATPRLRFPDY